MATTTIPWGDGSGDNLYFEADSMSGNQSVQVSSDENTGNTDRTKIVNFQASGVSPQPLQIIQLRGGGGTDFDAWLKDGDTHLWINIVNDYQKAQQIRIKMVGTIDWGDGSTKDTANVTAYTTFTHTYSDKGRYRIDLHPTSGTFELGGASTSYNVMGANATSENYRMNVLYQVEIGSSIITALSNYAFSNNKGLRRVYVPDEITTIGNQVFGSCFGLAQIVFEDWTKVTTFNQSNAFYRCYNLQDISGAVFTLGTSIASTIRDCWSLTEFTITSGVTSIAGNSFSATYGLQHLWCYPVSPPTVANANAFTGLNSSCVIHVPNGKLNTYKTADKWSALASQMVEMPA